ncbi:DUF3613 domain-containing protein [Guyparkeria hydrothermalis]|uniref:DUF3613 domain-containing protein n=1 Tax=Guyparkeria hydrothermalis TaxID=923 RepID=UPI0020212027|nr:DUF3613 domain-containing protein [Guyparkeria hydrothermalis]MCL7743711.1 DUF3613 domain-containing protein [Guyparkeria hydrothermalis]
MKGSVIPAVAMVLMIAVGGNPAMSAEQPKSTATETWLDLQRGGTASTPVHKRVEGEISQRSYRRLLKSFEREIPTRFFPSEGPNRGSRN